MDSFRVPLGFHLGCHLRFLQGCFRVSFRVSLGFHIGFQFRVSFRVSLGCQFRVSAKVSVQVSSTSPHLCVGFLFLVLYPARLRPPASVRRPPAASHTTYTHTTYTHTHNLHTHTHNLLTHNLLTHNLHTHTQLIYTQLTHTQLTHTQLTHTQLAHTHTTYSHTTCQQFHVATLRGRRGTLWHPHSLCVAGVALCVALGWLRWRAWAGLERRDAAAVGVAGVALGDIHLRFTWQAWHLVTSTCTFAWQAWHVWHWAGSGGALGPEWNAGMPRLLAWQAWHFVSRGRRGTWWHRLPLLRGRRGTYGTGLAPVARLGRSGTPGRRGCWCGRRGTWRHPSSFHVAVALGEFDFHFCVAGVARMALGWLRWRAGAGVERRDAAAVGVAGVALGRRHPWACTSAASLALLRTLWHVCVGWDCRTCVICSHLTPYIYMHPYIHPSIHLSIHTYIHAYIHAYNTICPYTTYSYVLFHTQLAPHQSFTISFPFPAFPMPSLHFFCCLLEEVDMWGYPVL